MLQHYIPESPPVVTSVTQDKIEPAHAPKEIGKEKPFLYKGGFFAQFLSGVLKPALAAAGSRDVLVVNTAREIPMQIESGPFHNQKGEIIMNVRLDINTLDVDIVEKEVYLDLLFLPISPPELGSFRITDDAILKLRTPLPNSLDLQDFLANIKKAGQLLVDLPPRAFAFRIRWEESSLP
jgi:hypothetical protein